MAIYNKLHALQCKIRGLAKDGKGYGYGYTSGNKILKHVRDAMDELGLILKQEVTSIENERIDYNTKQGKKSEILSKVMMVFTWVDIETGEMDVNQFGANGQNEWEKGLGSALTYGERYFLLKFFHIPTDEDDVDNSERKPQEAEKATAAAQGANAPRRAETPKKQEVTDAFVKKAINHFQTVDEFSEFKGRYALTKSQTDELLKLFKTLFPNNKK